MKNGTLGFEGPGSRTQGERVEMTVTDIFSHAKDPYLGRELTSSDVVLAAKEIEKLAVISFLGRSRLVEVALREWMSSQRAGTVTSRQEFERGVRMYLENRWGIS